MNLLLQTMVYDREIEVKDVKENFTNLEKECQAVKHPMSHELQVRNWFFSSTK